MGGKPLTSKVTHRTVALTDVADLPTAVSACDALGAEALAFQLADGSHPNALTSPASLCLSLAMAALGATDPAAQGLDQVLGCPDEETRNTTWSALQRALLAYDGDPATFDVKAEAPAKPFLHVANQLLVIDSEPEQTFVDAEQEWFTADLRRATTKEAKAVLDAWVNRNTGGLIKKSATEKIRPGLVLQNAVLLAARWAEVFDKNDTYDQDFTLADGTVVQVPRMMLLGSPLAYVTGTTDAGAWEAVRLPYTEALAMDVILPDAGVLPESLPAGTWAAATALLDQAAGAGELANVNLELPRIDVATPDGGYDVLELLDTLGVDARPMDRAGDRDYATEAYRQQVRIIVEEDGTKAAAVTEQQVVELAGPVRGDGPDFIVDRPYVMRVRHLETGLSLFEAIINDPRSEGKE